MQEEWIRWEPVDGLTGKYSVDTMSLGEQGLIIGLSSLSDNTKKIEIKFEYAIDAYRYTNDSFSFKIAGDLTEKYGREFYGDWSFFKVTNSEYIQWISEKSCTYADEFAFIHFSIVGSDEIVDVLSRYEPTVAFVE